MEDSSVVILACGVVIVLLLRGANGRCRNISVWIRVWIRNHECCSAYHYRLQELQLGDRETHINFLLMNTSTFEELLSLVGPQITFRDIHLWEAIPAEENSGLLSPQST